MASMRAPAFADAALVLADGTVFFGASFGNPAASIQSLKAYSSSPSAERDIPQGVGEAVFNTSMTGYVEVLTDPSFFGQIVCMTYPHMGNYGVDINRAESGMGTAREGIMAEGFVVHNLYTGAVPKGRARLDEWLLEQHIPGLCNVDTRALTIHIRNNGEQNSVIVSLDDEHDTGKKNPEAIDVIINAAVEYLRFVPGMEGANLVTRVGQRRMCEYKPEEAPRGKSTTILPADDRTPTPQPVRKIALYDCGCKRAIAHLLARAGGGETAHEVILFPHSVSADEIFGSKCDVFMVSNGPGDPAALRAQIECIRRLVGTIPLRGICLGTQLLALALGARTYKLSFGHHGANHPVQDITTGKLYITSQNHGFAVDADSLPGPVKPWFVNTNDKTLEGFYDTDKNIYSVQFHPEASPGPKDTQWIFDEFLRTL